MLFLLIFSTLASKNVISCTEIFVDLSQNGALIKLLAPSLSPILLTLLSIRASNKNNHGSPECIYTASKQKHRQRILFLSSSSLSHCQPPLPLPGLCLFYISYSITNSRLNFGKRFSNKYLSRFAFLNKLINNTIDISRVIMNTCTTLLRPLNSFPPQIIKQKNIVKTHT